MTVWIILSAVALVLALVGLVPLGLDAAWNRNGASAAVRIWFFTIRLGGDKKKAKEEKSAGKEKAGKGKSGPSGKKSLPPFPVLKILARNGYHTLCRIVSRLKVAELKLHFTSAFSDPAVTAMAYAAAGTAMDGLLHIGGGRIAHPDLRATVDFDSETPALDFHIRLNLRVHESLGEALGFGFRFLRDYLRYKREDAKHGKSDR